MSPNSAQVGTTLSVCLIRGIECAGLPKKHDAALRDRDDEIACLERQHSHLVYTNLDLAATVADLRDELAGTKQRLQATESHSVIADMDAQILALRSQLEASLAKRSTPVKRQAEDDAHHLSGSLADEIETENHRRGKKDEIVPLRKGCAEELQRQKTTTGANHSLANEIESLTKHLAVTECSHQSLQQMHEKLKQHMIAMMHVCIKTCAHMIMLMPARECVCGGHRW